MNMSRKCYRVWILQLKTVLEQKYVAIPKFCVKHMFYQRQSVFHITGVIKWLCEITGKRLENQQLSGLFNLGSEF